MVVPFSTFQPLTERIAAYSNDNKFPTIKHAVIQNTAMPVGRDI